RILSHEGDLRSVEAKALMNVRRPGLDAHIDATVHGKAVGAEFQANCELDGSDGKSVVPLDPVPLGAATTFSSFEPLHKYPPLRVGQTWRLSNVDTVTEALSVAFQQAVTKKTGIVLQHMARPKEVLARVTIETQDIVHRERRYTCRIVVFEADRQIARIWV